VSPKCTKRGNVYDSSLAHWKARSRLPIGYKLIIGHFSLCLMAEAPKSEQTSKLAFIEGVGQFEAKN